ncbi:MAG: N-formylglutamate amidohydrolase [Sulfuricella sp.]|nr:N-formylglutamate amidohydrolase [Sulfuricella sp.]
MMEEATHFIVTCEHGGNHVPARYRRLFGGYEGLLRTHRGYDAGALAMAENLAHALAAPLFSSTTSRLLVDLNRSIGHRGLFSEITKAVPDGLRNEILARCYRPYREEVEANIAAAAARGNRVIHLSSHSFTPELDGRMRNADIGLLYDPARPGEVELCLRWQAAFKHLAPDLRVRRNYPYAGKSDGFTVYLRRRFPANMYVGVELEINQRHVFEGGRHWRVVRQRVVDTLRLALAGEAGS